MPLPPISASVFGIAWIGMPPGLKVAYSWSIVASSTWITTKLGLCFADCAVSVLWRAKIRLASRASRPTAKARRARIREGLGCGANICIE